MPHLPVRPFARAASLAALVLLAGACADDPTEPRPAADAARAGFSTAAPDRPALVPSRIKYRDAGGRPSTGRSGSSTLTVSALQGRDGTTDMRVDAGTLDAGGPAPAIARVQVKQFTTSGELIRTLNHNDPPGGASASYTYPGLARGAKLQVQAGVREPARTAVVTVDGTIRLRPDLRVALHAPEEVLAGTPVNLLVTATEGNGDVGARADCVLYVDGVEADRARGIWVDAGDAVTCAFTHTFPAAGTPQLRVEVTDVEPGDFDPANNAATGTLRVVQPGPGPSDFSYYAFAEDALLNEVATYNYRIDYPATAQLLLDSLTFHTTTRVRNAMFNGWMPRGVALPLTRVELLQQTGGATVHAAAYTDVAGHEYAPVAGPDCVSRWSGRGMIFYLCTTLQYQHTSFQYLYYATDVTYVGRSHQHIWYLETGEYYFYNNQWTGGYTDGEPLFEIGPDYTFRVRITDGDQTWQAGARVVLQPDTPWTWTYYEPTGEYCESSPDPAHPWYRCSTHRGVLTRRVGWASHVLE